MFPSPEKVVPLNTFCYFFICHRRVYRLSFVIWSITFAICFGLGHILSQIVWTTYFQITIIHKITEVESVKNILVNTVGSIHAQQYSRNWWRPFFKMAAISSMKITFLGSFLRFQWSWYQIIHFDHAKSEFRPSKFSRPKSLFYKIWDKELKYIMG